jgi:hypothetical protein
MLNLVQTNPMSRKYQKNSRIGDIAPGRFFSQHLVSENRRARRALLAHGTAVGEMSERDLLMRAKKSMGVADKG